MKRILIVLLFSTFIYSCDSEDDCHEVVANVVDLKIQINELNGMNLLNNQNFDVSLFNVLSSTDNTTEIDFNIIGDIITLVHTGNIMFTYEGENKADLRLTDIESETNSCGAITSFLFTAQSNGQVVCECDSSDVINIEFDI